MNISNSEFAYNKGANGGALFVKWGNAVGNISGSDFHDNQTTDTTNGWGGAILVFDGGSATVGSTTFNLNQARDGGAVYVFSNSSLTVNNNSTLTGNKANGGGGINNQGTITLTNVTLNGNSSISYGGGIFNFATANLTHVTLSGNSSRDGSAIANYGGTSNLTNVTLSGNLSTFVNGVIYNFSGGTVNLTNVTLSGNSHGIWRSSGTINVKNTIFANSPNANCGNFTGGSFSLSDDNSCGFGAGRDNVTNLNLGSLANNGGFTQTHLPGAGSAAIDNGIGNGCPTTDQRGVSRPQGLACDVGSVEVVPTPTPTPTPSFTILVEANNTNQAVALDSVTFVRGPFRPRTSFNFSSDGQTRVILFTTILGLTQADVSKVTVTAGGFSLPVENVGPVQGVAGLNASYIVVRLVDGLPTGNLPLIVIVNGAQSGNSPTLGISP